LENQEILRLENIAKSFASNHVLKDVNFSLQIGEIRALVGENGAGKSTMVKIIAGASMPNNGTIFIAGKQVILDSPKDGLNAGITVIYQELDLLPEMTVMENIFLGIELKTRRNTLDKKAMADIVDKYFVEMHLEIDKLAKVGSLPIAKQQMVAITKAVVHNAKVLIMDEPSSSLTSKEQEILFDQIRRLKKKQVAVIYISHRIEEIFEICDSVTIMLDGRLVVTRNVRDIKREEIIELMIGKKVSEKRLNYRDTYDAPTILEVKDLSFNKILNSVAFKVKRGEIFGIIGLIGSGSIDLGKILYGIKKPTTGKIMMNGKVLNMNCPADALGNSISYVPDERRAQGLFMELNVEINAVITSLRKFMKNEFLGVLDYKGLDNAFMSYVDRFGIKIVNKKQKIQFLSGGNQQKILLARVLVRDSEIIILSCPTKGIDVGSKFEIYQILLDCIKQGKTVIVISQEIPELVQICDRILMLKRGQVYMEYEGSEISEAVIYNDLLSI